jgi:UDPglucose 6-dehydrogenase
MNITVYGNSTPALVCAACLADVGNDLLLVADHLPLPPFAEPGLGKLLQKQLDEGRLHHTTAIADGAGHGELHYLLLHSDQLPLARQIVGQLGQSLSRDCTVVNRTTFPLGSSDQLQQLLQRPGSSYRADLVVEPDFMTEGRMIQNFRRPDRILLGSDSAQGIERIRELYTPYNRNRDVVMVMSARAAELTKFASNAMLATRISFMNEMADVAEAFGADIEEVRQGIGSDHRIGFDYLYPGSGFGGPNFAKDVASLADTVRAAGSRGQLLDAVLDINEQQKEVLFRKAWRHFERNLDGRRFAIWGAAYKPGSSDIRNAPAVRLIEALLGQGAEVQLYDPEAMGSVRSHFGERQGLSYGDNHYQVLEQADALMVVTEWKPFWSPDFQQLLQRMRGAVIFDGRNLYPPAKMKKLGITYYGIGRGESVADSQNSIANSRKQ